MRQSSVNMRVYSIQTKHLLFIVKLIVYGLKIIGLAPFTVLIKPSAQTNPHNTSIQAFHFSKIGLAYNILLLLPAIPATAFISHFLNSSSEYHSDEASEFANTSAQMLMAEKAIVIPTAWVVVIFWGYKQKTATSIMNRLLKVHNQLSILNKHSFDKRSLTLLIGHAVINTSLWMSFLIWRIGYFHLNFDKLIPTFLAKIPNYITYWFVVEYYIIVGFLARYLGTINEYLLNINESGNYSSRPQIEVGSRFILVVSLATDHNSQLFTLKLLHSVRSTISELCEDISDFFSVPILLGIICCVMPLVCELLTAILFAATSNVTATTAFYVVLLVFLYVFPIISLSLNISRTKKQAKITGQIVHKLLAESMPREIETELTHFSLHLLHEDVQFTAWGLFTLDSGIFLTILGGLATYSLNLIQLVIKATSKNSNSTSTLS